MSSSEEIAGDNGNDLISIRADSHLIANLGTREIEEKLVNAYNNLSDFEQKRMEYEDTFILLKPFIKGELNQSMRGAISAIGEISKVTLYLQNQSNNNQKILKVQNECLYNTQIKLEEQTKKNEENTNELKQLIEDFLKLKNMRLDDLKKISSNITELNSNLEKKVFDELILLKDSLSLSVADANVRVDVVMDNVRVIKSEMSFVVQKNIEVEALTRALQKRGKSLLIANVILAIIVVLMSLYALKIPGNLFLQG